MKRELSRQFFVKYSTIKSSENPSNKSRAVPCGHMDARRDTTKLTAGFRNFPKALKNVCRAVMGCSGKNGIRVRSMQSDSVVDVC